MKFFIKDFFSKCDQIRRKLQGEKQRRSRTAATSKMEDFVTIVNGWKPVNIITKNSILDVAAVLDASLRTVSNFKS